MPGEVVGRPIRGVRFAHLRACIDRDLRGALQCRHVGCVGAKARRIAEIEDRQRKFEFVAVLRGPSGFRVPNARDREAIDEARDPRESLPARDELEISAREPHVEPLVERHLHDGVLVFRRRRQLGEPLGQCKACCLRRREAEQAHQCLAGGRRSLACAREPCDRLGREHLLPCPLQLAEVPGRLHAARELGRRIGSALHLLVIRERLRRGHRAQPCLPDVARRAHDLRGGLQAHVRLLRLVDVEPRGQQDEVVKRKGQQATDLELLDAALHPHEPFEREHGVRKPCRLRRFRGATGGVEQERLHRGAVA